MPQLGSHAPDFTLPDADMELIKLSRYKGKNVVLYFYPKDDTPSCTQEAIEFSDLIEEFTKRNTEVVGVSRDDCLSHAEFRDKHGLAIQLLSDVDGKVCEKYGVWKEHEKEGVRKMGILRSTFVIDKSGTIRQALYGVTAKGHAAEILNIIKELQ
ncbi:peroxiredoxin Q/BCP [Novimethylophilus kurashikiensis]|uniref:thioredoxin-dependent peroxiredoxin n=1 Tax=Novimethylophilus kurashikiensis TaxID=1825523 RepID=A0A2R5F7G2_9PROT|nr:peroxiredoxin [Novimethylophilus kurashikiensis]GBG14127.1 peroxiredoxin Q/BCP [Novimethylophilus kurashikiensis]